jgi:hypothetical protein
MGIADGQMLMDRPSHSFRVGQCGLGPSALSSEDLYPGASCLRGFALHAGGARAPA